MTGQRFPLTRRSGLRGGAGLILAGIHSVGARGIRPDHDADQSSGHTKGNSAAGEGISGGTALLPPFGTGWGLIDPVERLGAKPVVYAGTTPDPAWLISQWGIGGKRLPPFRQQPDADVWVTHGPTARVMVSPREVRLEQHGRELECDVRHGQAREFDLFLSPARMVHQSVATPQRMTLSLAFEAKIGKSRREHECHITQGATLVAFVLGNATAKQTLFYQIHFQVERERGREMHEEQPRHLAWFWRRNPFGVDQYLGNEGPVVNRSFDILPLVRRVIASAPHGADRNVEHWTVNSTYAGQHIWGGATVTSTWHEYSLMVA